MNRFGRNVKQDLADFSQQSVGDLRVGRLAKLYSGAVARRQAQDEANSREFRLNIPHVEQVRKKIAEELDREAGQINGNLPVASVFDAYRIVKARKDLGTDHGLRALYGHLEGMWKKNRTGSITASSYLTLHDHYKRNFPKSAAAEVIVEIGQKGYATLPINDLQRIASQIETQEDYDRLILKHGLNGPLPHQVKARRFVLSMVNGEEPDLEYGEETADWVQKKIKHEVGGGDSGEFRKENPPPKRKRQGPNARRGGGKRPFYRRDAQASGNEPGVKYIQTPRGPATVQQDAPFAKTPEETFSDPSQRWLSPEEERAMSGAPEWATWNPLEDYFPSDPLGEDPALNMRPGEAMGDLLGLEPDPSLPPRPQSQQQAEKESLHEVKKPKRGPGQVGKGKAQAGPEAGPGHGGMGSGAVARRQAQGDDFEPDEDDVFIQSASYLGGEDVYFAGKHLGEFVEWDGIEDAIREEGNRQQYWPNIWHVSDHGNFHLVEDFDWDKPSREEEPPEGELWGPAWRGSRRQAQEEEIKPDRGLAEDLLKWHGGQGSALYALGSNWSAGHPVEKDVIEAAHEELEDAVRWYEVNIKQPDVVADESKKREYREALDEGTELLWDLKDVLNLLGTPGHEARRQAQAGEPDPTIVEAMARAFFVSSWADEWEEADRLADEVDVEIESPNFMGAELMNIAPETPPEAIEFATNFYRDIERSNNVDLETFIPPGEDEDFNRDEFGHYLAMEGMGHGVGWYDSHEHHGLEIPHTAGMETELAYAGDPELLEILNDLAEMREEEGLER